MTTTEPIVGITMGDPCGIGPELSLLGASKSSHYLKNVIIGDHKRLELALDILKDNKRLSEKTQLVAGKQLDDLLEVHIDSETIAVLDLANIDQDLPWGIVTTLGGKASFAYVETAIALATEGAIGAICTGPINKKSWGQAKVPFAGHTEALASLCEVKDYAMMLSNDSLRAIHVTTHQSLASAIKSLSAEKIAKTSRLADRYLKQIGIERPRIAVAALNPHGGEGGLFGTEEIEIITPVIEQLILEGVEVSGPYPADTIFGRAHGGEFDAVIALYHDQGHLAVKMLGLDTGVNTTIGLPILRTSVDHGTAFDIAGSGIVNEKSMLAALQVVNEHFKRQMSLRAKV